MGDRDTTARARELGAQLRRIREQADITGAALADRLGWSPSKVTRIDQGIRGIHEIDVVRYAAYCGVTRDRLDQLLDICREATGPGFWLSNRLSTLVFHETSADSSVSYDPLVVPGLLQTEEYATALIAQHVSDPDQVREFVSARMERQRIVHRRPFCFYVHEQALRLPVAGPAVMNEQLLKLLLLGEHPHISIRVLPTDLGERSAVGGSFVLFRYAGHRPLVYVETDVASLFLEDPDYVRRCQAKLPRLADAALDQGQSRELLATLASSFDLPEGSRDVSGQVAEE